MHGVAVLSIVVSCGIALIPLAVLARQSVPAGSPAAPVVFAGAGSLRGAIAQIAEAYTQQTHTPVTLVFGSSGTLEHQIAAGELRPDLFASADMELPRKLNASGSVIRYARNAMCAVARADWTVAGQTQPVRTATLQSALADPAERIGTSTPPDDPSGSYARDILHKAGAAVAADPPQSAYDLPANARMLFGGYAGSPPVPPATDPIGYFLTTPPPDWSVDVILTYCSTARAAVARTPGLELIALPPKLATVADYGYTVPINAANAAGGTSLGEFLLTPPAQAIFAVAGFLAP